MLYCLPKYRMMDGTVLPNFILMNNTDVILRFNDVSFSYAHEKSILHETSFSLRRGAKMTLMGQNGAGKSTIFQLITGQIAPESGTISISDDITVALARQVMPEDQLKMTVREFFESAFGGKKIYDIEPRIKKALDAVGFSCDFERHVHSFSGGQQARLLLAFALIQNPDLLLLDEPTNNLDAKGISHLKKFLIEYPKTCMVISHDAEFLNSFTHGVFYLDIFSHAVEQYVGNYFNVVEEIAARIERERMKNVRLEREIAHRKEQANFFAQKGGHMRDVARKMKEKIGDLEEDVVDVRQEDKTIRNFFIPTQEDIVGEIVSISSLATMHNHKLTNKKVKFSIKKREHILLAGPNGIGKSTLLKSIAGQTAKGVVITPGTRIGYYAQDFSMLNPSESVYRVLAAVSDEVTDQELRSVAAGFLLTSEILKTNVRLLSEGQKGLVSFARLVLQRPGLLLLDEPTNHINFRHLPVIAEALSKFDGTMILVSHARDFVKKIRIDSTIDLETLTQS